MLAIQRNDISAMDPLTAKERNHGIKALLVAGWKQEQVAEATGVHQTTIMNIHNSLALRGEVTKPTGGKGTPKAMAVLPPDVAERLPDTVLYRVATVDPDQQQEFATAVADADIAEPRVREAIKAMKDEGKTPTAAVASVTPARMVMPVTMPEVAKQVRRRLERFLEEPMTVEGKERDFWAVLEVLASNTDGMPLEAKSLARLLSDVEAKAHHYASALNSARELAEVQS